VGRGLTNQAVKRGIPVVGTNHLMPANLLEFTVVPRQMRPLITRAVWRSARKSFLRSAVVTTPTERAAAYLEDHAGLRNVRAISCGVDLSDFNPSFAVPRSRKILFVGRITREKRIDVLIKAFALLDPSFGATLTIVGTGEQRSELELLAEDLGVADRVSFTGYVDSDELRTRLGKGAFFVMPSVAELQSIATLEAMASGLPIVAANAMALPHLVVDGRNGRLFDPDHPADLAEKMSYILGLPEPEYLAMRRESVSLVQVHDLARTIEQFEGVYREVLGSATSRR
jgi:glycosyltransferase involved in cell wall biosynthesis